MTPPITLDQFLTLQKIPAPELRLPHRILLVQYSGDFRETMRRFDAGQEETYYAQKYSVQTLADLVPKVESVTALVCMTEQAYEETLSNGIRAIGAGFQERLNPEQLIPMIAAQRPTHLILHMPDLAVLRWAIDYQIQTLVVLADSFEQFNLNRDWHNLRKWKSQWFRRSLVKLLNHPTIQWVTNHGINSTRSLQAMGVNSDKLIPWDWPAMVMPSQFEPKQLPKNKQFSLLFVGAIAQSKGIGDVIQAIARLRQQGFPVQLQAAGKGDVETFAALAQSLGVADSVEFLGQVSHSQVIHRMRSADLVVVPSHPSYPEGLPMTIYEALCSRTPVIISDHPMFQGRLIHQQETWEFQAKHPESLAIAAIQVLGNSQVYRRLSQQSEVAWQRLQLPVKFRDLLYRWLFKSQDRRWFEAHSLKGREYQ